MVRKPLKHPVVLDQEKQTTMKVANYLLVICTLLAVNVSATEPEKLSTQDSVNLRAGYFLDFSGVMTVNDQKVDDYTVYIYQDGTLLDSFYVTSKREQYYELPLNHNFALKFRKEGYRERVILVDTHVPDSESIHYYTFRYSIEFISEDQPSNTFDDFPVAYVVFQKTKKDFDYDRKYHRNTRNVNVNTAKSDNPISVR